MQLGYAYNLSAGFHAGMGATTGGPISAGTTVDYRIPQTGWGLWGGTIAETQDWIVSHLLSSGKFSTASANVVSNHDGIIADSYSIEVIATTSIGFPSPDALKQEIIKAISGSGLSGDSTGSFITLGSTDIVNNPTPVLPANDPQRGIFTILGDPDQGDYDVIYSDPNQGAGIFNDQGLFYSGNQDGIDYVQITVDDSGNDAGYVAVMKDGTQVFFDFSGNYEDTTYAPGHAPGAGTTPVITPGMTAAQIAQAIAAAKSAAIGTGQGTLDRLGAQLGLTGVGAALGIGAGTLLIIGGVVLYGVLKK